MRSIVVLFLVALGLAVGVGPAAAGGPTSVIITEPSAGRAAALYNGDAAYAQLQSILDSGERVGGSSSHDGSMISVTWLIHDVDPWRIDRVLFEADGSAVVETTMLMDGRNTVRHKLDKPMQLTALLTTIGLRGSAPAVAPVAQRSPVPSAVGTDDRWEWGIGGVLVGLAAAGLVVAARRVRAAR